MLARALCQFVQLMSVSGCGARAADELGRSELYSPPLSTKGSRREGGRNDKSYHGDGVARLLLAAHWCFFSFSFSACPETETRRLSNTDLPRLSPL